MTSRLLVHQVFTKFTQVTCSFIGNHLSSPGIVQPCSPDVPLVRTSGSDLFTRLKHIDITRIFTLFTQVSLCSAQWLTACSPTLFRYKSAAANITKFIGRRRRSSASRKTWIDGRLGLCSIGGGSVHYVATRYTIVDHQESSLVAPGSLMISPGWTPDIESDEVGLKLSPGSLVHQLSFLFDQVISYVHHGIRLVHQVDTVLSPEQQLVHQVINLVRPAAELAACSVAASALQHQRYLFSQRYSSLASPAVTCSPAALQQQRFICRVAASSPERQQQN